MTNPDPIEDLKAQLRMKQDDWIKECQESERLEAALAEAREMIVSGERALDVVADQARRAEKEADALRQEVEM